MRLAMDNSGSPVMWVTSVSLSVFGSLIAAPNCPACVRAPTTDAKVRIYMGGI